MSWSLEFKGTPADIVEKLEEFGQSLSEPSKQEFEQALPHIKGVVDMNYGNEAKLHLTANGHAFIDGDKTTQSTLQVHVRQQLA